MNFRSKIFILTGLIAIIALFLANQLILPYYDSGEGNSLLNINRVEILLFGMAVFVFLIDLILISILLKRNTYPLTFKKRFQFLIPSFMGLIIVFLLIDRSHSELIVPSSIVIYGLVLLNFNRFVRSRLSYFSGSLILLGLISYFFADYNWSFLGLAFGLMPILFGSVLLNKKTADTSV